MAALHRIASRTNPSVETERLHLSAKDQALFAQVLINPPQHNHALRKAFERHRILFAEQTGTSL